MPPLRLPLRRLARLQLKLRFYIKILRCSLSVALLGAPQTLLSLFFQLGDQRGVIKYLLARILYAAVPRTANLSKQNSKRPIP